MNAQKLVYVHILDVVGPIIDGIMFGLAVLAAYLRIVTEDTHTYPVEMVKEHVDLYKKVLFRRPLPEGISKPDAIANIEKVLDENNITVLTEEMIYPDAILSIREIATRGEKIVLFGSGKIKGFPEILPPDVQATIIDSSILNKKDPELFKEEILKQEDKGRFVLSFTSDEEAELEAAVKTGCFELRNLNYVVRSEYTVLKRLAGLHFINHNNAQVASMRKDAVSQGAPFDEDLHSKE